MIIFVEKLIFRSKYCIDYFDTDITSNIRKNVSCKATCYNFHVIVISIYTHEKSYDFHKRRHKKRKISPAKRNLVI